MNIIQWTKCPPAEGLREFVYLANENPSQASSPNYKKNHNPKFGIRNPSPEKQKTDDRRQMSEDR